MKDELKKLETRIRWAAKDALADRKHDESENYLGFADELRDLIATLPEDAGWDSEPVAFLDTLLGDVALPSEFMEGSNPMNNGYVPLYRRAVPATGLEE